MDFFSVFFLPLLLCVTTILIYLSLIYKCKTQPNTSTKNPINDDKLPLPPGRTGWPLIGETINYISKLKKGIPQNFVIENFKKHSSKVFKTSLFGQPMAILYGAEGNKFLFFNERKLVQNWLPSHLDDLFMRPDYSSSLNNHDEVIKLRKKLTPFIKGEGLQKFVSKMDSLMREHLKRYWDREEIKVGVEVRKYTLKLALWLYLSLDDDMKVEELSPLLDSLAAGIPSVPIKLPGTTFSRGIKASKLLLEEVEDRLKQWKIDLLEKVALLTPDVFSLLLTSNGKNGQFWKVPEIVCAVQDRKSTRLNSSH